MTGQRCRYESGGKGIENEIRSQIYLISVGGVRFFPAIKMREAMPDDRFISTLLCRISRIESRRRSVLERLDSYAVLSSGGAILLPSLFCCFGICCKTYKSKYADF